MQVNCTNPTIILNPLVSELVALHGNIVFRGKNIHFYNSNRLLYEFNSYQFQPSRNHITLDDFDSCYIVDSVTGENYPLYLQVPCGHCEVCCHAKMNSFVDRCKLETQTYNSNPLFITLTYDEHNKKECGVCLRDLQLFFKRLRITLYRKGYRERITYAAVSEYGKRTFRPHYHVLLWNCHSTDFLSYIEIRNTIEKCWPLGFSYIRQVDPSNDKAFYYTSKYLCKNSHVPEGCNETFMVCSNRGGSIGARFIDSLRLQAVKHLNTHIKYVNKWNGRTEQVRVSRYMLNRLVPSLSHSIPYSVKCRVRRFCFDYLLLKKRDDYNQFIFAPQLDRYIDFFDKYFYIYRGDIVGFDFNRSTDSVLREMLQDEVYIERAIGKGSKFYEDAVIYAEKRPKYLQKLFLEYTEQNLQDKSYKIRRMNEYSAQREIL